jgi:hypothetical protein
MVLHDISDDAEFVKVAASAFCAKGFFEGDLHVGDVLAGPSCTEEGICKTEDEQVLDHFLAEVMVNAEGLACQ